MFKEVQEVRYTNETQDTLYVLFNDDDGNTQEMYIENGGADHKALMELGVTDEQIVEQTAEWKKSAARDIISLAKAAAYEEYGEEVERLKHEALKARAAKKAEMVRSNESAVTAYALDQKLQSESLDKIRSVNKYVAEQLGNEKLEVAVANLKAAVKALNDNEEAIAIAGNGKKYKTLLGALKATI